MAVSFQIKAPDSEIQKWAQWHSNDVSGYLDSYDEAFNAAATYGAKLALQWIMRRLCDTDQFAPLGSVMDELGGGPPDEIVLPDVLSADRITGAITSFCQARDRETAFRSLSIDEYDTIIAALQSHLTENS
jgi:hypothetical protein